MDEDDRVCAFHSRLNIRNLRFCECAFFNLSLVIWWTHIIICWAVSKASVVAGSRGTWASTRLNEWPPKDTQLLTTTWTLMGNIFCTVSTKWNATTTESNKCYIIKIRRFQRGEDEKNVCLRFVFFSTFLLFYRPFPVCLWLTSTRINCHSN